jgi:hypothetical protein
VGSVVQFFLLDKDGEWCSQLHDFVAKPKHLQDVRPASRDRQAMSLGISMLLLIFLHDIHIMHSRGGAQRTDGLLEWRQASEVIPSCAAC